MTEYISQKEAGFLMGMSKPSTIRIYISLLTRYFPGFPKICFLKNRVAHYDKALIQAFINSHDVQEIAKELYKQKYRNKTRERKITADFEFSEHCEKQAIDIAKGAKGLDKLRLQFLAGKFSPAAKTRNGDKSDARTVVVRVRGFN